MMLVSTFHSVYISTRNALLGTRYKLISTFHSVYISTECAWIYQWAMLALHSTLFILVPVL